PPLLEEERYTCGKALISNIDYPLRVHWARPRARLSANDHPLDSLEVQSRQGAQQGLQRQELDVGSALSQMLDAENIVLVFDAYPSPHIARPEKLSIEFE
ncbi:unnamed protein product, partial [marine sediment metagenome]